MHRRMGDEIRHRCSEEAMPMEIWRNQIQSCIAATATHIQQSPLWANLSQWPSSLLQHSGLAAIATNASKHLQRTLPLHTLLSPHQHCTQKYPLLAYLSSHHHRHGKHLFDVALSSEDISQKLDGIPVYAVCNNSSEFVLVSDSTNQKSLGFFCFRRSDAEALLQQVKAREPLAGKGAKVVAVSLNKVYKLHAEGIAFRFLPDPQQVKNALQVSGGFEERGRSFDGVPVFQSNNLIVRSNDIRFCPVFFCKEDLEQALQRASKLQQKINPSLQVNTDIQVGSFEHVLKQMEGSVNEQEWGDIVFIPPGMTALGQLEDANKTTIS
eukprot:c19385_g1_i1 orf=53-1024(+)